MLMHGRGGQTVRWTKHSDDSVLSPYRHTAPRMSTDHAHMASSEIKEACCSPSLTRRRWPWPVAAHFHRLQLGVPRSIWPTSLYGQVWRPPYLKCTQNTSICVYT
jgi:hypothetical protein